jgi:hypothetical protein
MQELIPIVLGLGIGVAAGRHPGRRLATRALLASLVLGTMVAFVTGELAHSVGYAIFDSGVIACTAVLAVIAQRLAWRARRPDRDTTEGARHG